MCSTVVHTQTLQKIVPLGERRNRFLKNIPIINNTILIIYSIYTYFLCSSTYCSI